MTGKGGKMDIRLSDEEAWALTMVLRNIGSPIRYTASTRELVERIRQNVMDVSDRDQRNLPRYA